MVVIFINFSVIPLLVDLSAASEGYHTKSEVKIVTTHRIYFFMLLNTLLIPVTGSASALNLFESVQGESVAKVPSMLSANLMSQQYFYMKFIIQLSFVTNGISMIDGAHRLTAWCKEKLHNRRQRNSASKTPFEDDSEYDLAYNQSYCLVIFLNCLLFSTIVPVIPVFASLFFYIKYTVDKNNLVFVYFKKHESGGQLRSSVKKYMMFNLVVYMTVMASFFALKFSNGSYYWLGPAFMAAWAAVYLYFRSQLEPFYNASEARTRKLEAMQKDADTTAKDQGLSEIQMDEIKHNNYHTLSTSYVHPYYRGHRKLE